MSQHLSLRPVSNWMRRGVRRQRGGRRRQTTRASIQCTWRVDGNSCALVGLSLCNDSIGALEWTRSQRLSPNWLICVTHWPFVFLDIRNAITSELSNNDAPNAQVRRPVLTGPLALISPVAQLSLFCHSIDSPIECCNFRCNHRQCSIC